MYAVGPMAVMNTFLSKVCVVSYRAQVLGMLIMLLPNVTYYARIIVYARGTVFIPRKNVEKVYHNVG